MTKAKWKRDYVRIAKDYAKEILDPKQSKRFGRWVKLAARRFLRDLERAASDSPPFTFDEFEASNPCDFIEKLPHVEGNWGTENIELHSSDIFFIVNLFGFRNADGTRRFTQALKAIARKNAKSTIAAAIGIYCETCEGENGPQVISAATTGSQARIVFGIANKMVVKKSSLREAFRLEALANSIVCFENNGTFKPINSKASTQDGLNPSCSIMDEIHAHKTHDLINVLTSAAGARSNPLFLYTTTEGYDNPTGPWAELRHFAKQVLLGVIPETDCDHFLVLYFALDEEDKTEGIERDDDFDEVVWEKANPLMKVNPLLLREMKKEAVQAKVMPGRLAEFRIKRLNRPSASLDGFINIVKWKQAVEANKLDLEWLRQFTCHAGLDLANTRDLTVLRLVWIIEKRIYTYGWRWVPRMTVAERKAKNLVPYDTWVQNGQLLEAGDEVTDYDVVGAKVKEVCSTFRVGSVNYDPWNAKQIAQKLKGENVPMVEFIQGTKSYHPCIKRLEEAYIEGNIITGNDPVLNWCASNLVVRKDENLNMAPDKKRSPDKIDDVVALLEGIGGAIANLDEDTSDFFKNPIVIVKRSR